MVATHLDVTDIVIARAEVQQDRTAAAADRLQVLLRVGDMLATSRLGHAELMNSIVNLSSAAIGDGAALRILTPTCTDRPGRDRAPGRRLRRRLESPLHEVRGLAGARSRDPAARRRQGKLVSRSGRTAGVRNTSNSSPNGFFDETEHFMMAPLRHNGSVLGMLVVVRTDPHRPYRSGTTTFLQVLADGAGAAIAEIRPGTPRSGSATNG